MLLFKHKDLQFKEDSFIILKEAKKQGLVNRVYEIRDPKEWDIVVEAPDISEEQLKELLNRFDWQSKIEEVQINH